MQENHFSIKYRENLMKQKTNKKQECKTRKVSQTSIKTPDSSTKNPSNFIPENKYIIVIKHS